MSFDIALKVENLSKCYQIYNQPHDRLKQSIYPRFQRLAGKQPKQYFGEFWALKDVSFEVKKGQTVGIIGQNGSGKSTLLQMICGTVSPTSGSFSTRGRVAALLELGAGFNSEFTGRENVLLNAAILGLPREEMEARMHDVQAFSELGDFLDQPVKTYSSGMYSRLAFSIAIHVDPEILIVDEALAVGDARFVAKCMRRIKDIQAGGGTILFVSHDVGSVRALCGRAVWLHKGRLVENGDVFPVTGRFMAFMFRDEKTQQDPLFEAFDAINTAQADTAAKPLDVAVAADTARDLPVALDSRPVTHWGSRKGLILSAAVHDEHGVYKDVHPWGATVNVVIDLCIPLDVPRENLNVAFSIKDIKGTDLIVSASQDFPGRQLPDKERLSVSFTLTNFLVTGSYLLVAAVENRQHRDIHYYEYVEGAHYFSSLLDKWFVGAFQPPVELQIKEHD